ncbi:2250_t:CDS:2 [Acaulospora morrowiae]|uniref:RING-type E3 ubiquitin transferase n=1 Tax=Acaulospora morrowiae TaxID=94023 RepID=A0A9N9BB52_9GLOM|nr:2250_t:CDS:2 [Acaulospora morrowiae]
MSADASNQPSTQGQTRREPHSNFRGRRHYRTSYRDQNNNTVSTRKVKDAVTTTESDEDPSFKENRETCFICAEPITVYAVSCCNHRTCHLCSLRLRALYKTRNCTYCKTEQDKVIFTRDPDKPFEDFEDRNVPYHDKKLNVFCEDPQIFEDVNTLMSYNCPHEKCTTLYNGWHDLKRHVRRDHNMWLCDICIKEKKVFVYEHTLFTKRALEEHIERGDESGFKGHPYCKFCNRNFYGEDELYNHCRYSHEQCPICERSGIRHQYYIDYVELLQHFKDEHYLCKHKECLEKKFIVFKTDIDLKAHEDGGGGGNINNSTEENRRQAQNIIVGESSTIDNSGDRVTARIRPPPGFGVLTPDEPAGSPDDSPPLTVIHPPIREQSSRAEDFPTLKASMKVGNNSERPRPDRLSTPVRPSTSQQPQPGNANRGKITVHRSEASGSSSIFKERSPSRDDAFPALPAPGNAINYSQKIKANTVDFNNKSRQVDRISSYLSNDKSKIDEYNSLLASYKAGNIDATKYIGSLSLLFNENLGKAIPVLVDLFDENVKKELLGAWQDHKVMKAFPALEPSENVIKANNSPVQNKTSPRVLVIKSSNTRSGGARPSSSQVWDRVAAAALKSSTKTNSASASYTNSAWKDFPQLTKSTPQASSSSTGDSSSSPISTTITGFIKGRPTKFENNDDFPGLPIASSSTHVVNNNKSEKSAWGHGGAFSSLTSGQDKESEVDSDDDLYFSKRITKLNK